MQLTVIGLNHNSAPIDIREKFAVHENMLENQYNKILNNERIYEAMILSTCNRVEYYAVTDDYVCSLRLLSSIIEDNSVQDSNILKKYLYIYCGDDALIHIFRVATGIDSLVIGEPQIFGQVKDAFNHAKQYGKFSTFLKKLEEETIKVAKKIRTNTKIARNPITVAYAAIQMAKQVFGKLENKNALVIGAGKMCELAAQHLASNNLKNLYVTNRTYEKAFLLAKNVDGKVADINNIDNILLEIDVVISSTSSENFILDYAYMASLMIKRKYKPIFFMDMAVPRDIDPECNKLENVYIYDIDDLKSIVVTNKKIREKEIVKAKTYLESGVKNMNKWLESLNIIPIIKSLRQAFEENKYREVERICNKFNINNYQERERMQFLISSYINRVLHTPLTVLKDKSSDKNKYTLADSIKIIFGLDEE